MTFVLHLYGHFISQYSTNTINDIVNNELEAFRTRINVFVALRKIHLIVLDSRYIVSIGN